MKLITEQVEEVKLIVEEKLGKGKEYFLEGIFLQSNLKNRNGRIYPREIMEKEVNRYSKEYIDKNRAFGELGHPDTPSINLDRTAILIKSLKSDGDNWIGKAKVMDTPYGKIVKNLIDEGAQLGVSSRGLGSLKSVGGVNMVQDDFLLASAADVVADPSAPEAFVNGIMENAEWIYNAATGTWMLAEQIKHEIQGMSAKDVAQNQAKMFSKFLNSLK